MSLDDGIYEFGHTPISKREMALAPVSSWWATAPRDGFTSAHAQQARKEVVRAVYVPKVRVVAPPASRKGIPRGKTQWTTVVCRTCPKTLPQSAVDKGMVRCTACRRAEATRTRRAA